MDHSNGQPDRELMTNLDTGSLTDDLSTLPPLHGRTFILSRVPVLIRPAQEKDIPNLDWAAEDLSVHEARWSLHTRGEGAFLLATINDLPVGYALVRWDGVAPGPASEEVPEIEALYVLPALRGFGIGSALIAACEDACRERGFRGIGITLHPVRHSYARALYERLGYRYRTTYLRGIRPRSQEDAQEGGLSLLAMQLVKDLRSEAEQRED
ncbi:MAG: hypothetical protein KatS3mg115_1002 [Candidatus Poribacteria bacterium]|nr:MAG: hypothetical protein KatS3mg115_1002 [Candidatus Poribacteria bacterium]